MSRSINHYQERMETLLERNIGIEKYFSYIVLKSPIVKNALPLKALLDTPQYARPDCTNHREERDCNGRFAPEVAIPLKSQHKHWMTP